MMVSIVMCLRRPILLPSQSAKSSTQLFWHAYRPHLLVPKVLAAKQWTLLSVHHSLRQWCVVSRAVYVRVGRVPEASLTDGLHGGVM